MSAHTPMLFSQSDENHENVDEHSDEHLDFIHTHASTLYIYHIIYIYIIYKSDLREIGGSVLLCFFAAIDSSGDGKAKSGLKFFVTQKLAAWQRF
jgi:hypothetical protein